MFLQPLTGVVVLEMAVAALSAGHAQTPATNLDILRTLAGRAAADVRAELALPSGDAVLVTVLPQDIAWTVDQGVVSAFAPVTAHGESAAVHAVFGVRDVQIAYQDIERDGFFGPKTAARLIRMTVSVSVTQQVGGGVMLQKDIEKEYADRIPVADIPAVEHPTLALARGSLAPEGWFSSIGEPLILIGTLGIAVFLLFHVRS